ncbi:PAQR family membrane homeostasis protein TrhA [Fusibacter sp. JL216-2]|uniref:PAQR family membrane homeostasis protein TrhA n=1 Tax=Fusibacter sp. JL216-2 TaxID=3071453 RepID=UPI003D33700F
MFNIKEPVNALTHLAGAVLSSVALVWMIIKGVSNGSTLQIVSALVFGLSLIALYTASTVYHWVPSSEKVDAILRRVDHSMIYILIAGTYTPVCLIALKGTLGWTLFGIVWGLAALGIVMKLVWFNAPRWLYTAFYLILGWMAIFFIVPLYKSLPLQGFVWLIVGGLSYSLGSVIYATKSKKIQISVFGFHEIFHLFVLGGSLAHFLMIEKFILV